MEMIRMPDLQITVDQKLFLETCYRVLSMLEPDRTTDRGKRDMEIKGEMDALINYLLAPRPSATGESSYPRIGVSRT
jgi:hypothetical protein